MAILAGDSGFERKVRGMAESVQSRHRYHSIELPDGSVLPGLQSIETLRRRVGHFGLPEDLRGRRVLDIGAWDGWFSFECERRGAEVVAVDCVELDTFLEARELLESKVDYRTLDVTELSARRLGRFDVVLFLGVLYHLRHPLQGLEKVVELCTDVAAVESFVIPSESRSIPAVMEFYERGELGGQIDNWCGPSPECLLAMCRSAGFAQAEVRDITSQRASVRCERRWPTPGAGLAPHLNSAVDNRSYRAYFHELKDEYVCCYFKSYERELTPDSVFIEVDGFGVSAVAVVSHGGDAWQANCVRPPGLDPGRHRVRVRTASSALSNAVEFVMVGESGAIEVAPSPDLPAEAPELCSAEYQASGDLRLSATKAGTLVCYFRSSARVVGPADVAVEVGGMPARPDVVSSLGDGVWQANTMLARPPAPGAAVRMRLGAGEWSGAVSIGHAAR